MSALFPAVLAGVMVGIVAWMGYRALTARPGIPGEPVRIDPAGPRAPAQAVADFERWKRINLRGLHPLNREEVQRLLGVVREEGAGALSPGERLFLDNMALPRAR